jgi:hypothetical protein
MKTLSTLPRWTDSCAASKSSNESTCETEDDEVLDGTTHSSLLTVYGRE